MGLWTETHAITILPTFVVFTVLAIVIAKLLKDKPENVRWLPFRIMAGIIVVLEIVKQVLAFDGGEYDLYSLPFHYCSLFLYLFPLHAFVGLFIDKNGKAKKIMDTLALVCGASLVLMMLTMPANIYSADAIKGFTDSFSSFHTVFFHNLASFYVFLMVAMKMYEINVKQDLVYTAIFLSAYVILATILSYTLETNFHNLYKCNIDMFWDVVISMEQIIGVWARVIYVAIVFVLTTVIAYIGYFLAILIAKLSDVLAKSFSKSKVN